MVQPFQARKQIRPRIRNAIIQSLRAGVTPHIGIQHIQVGRVNEIQAICQDIESIADGGAAFRLIIGDYGSGKTFFLSLARSIALEKKLVTLHADLSPTRRIHASAGQARSLYSELMVNLSTRSKPDGNGLVSVVERFISVAIEEAEEAGLPVEKIIRKRLGKLDEYVGGYDFSKVIEAYWKGHQSGDDVLKSNAIRWLRAEFRTKSEAKKALGITSIISDASFYDNLKIMSLFVKQAGYAGLLVNLDEMVNLYKLRSTQARTSNYEQILRMLNDCLQGGAQHLGFILGGTPEFLLDTRRGLYSYDALATRLAANLFAQKAGVIDYASPTLNLANLSPEELFILLKNLRHVFAGGDPEQYLIPDEALEAFLLHCSEKIGAAYFRTPRNTIKAFIDLLSVLEQNPTVDWTDLIETITLREEMATDMPHVQTGDNELSTFKI